jgi:hypothetical protein
MSSLFSHFRIELLTTSVSIKAENFLITSVNIDCFRRAYTSVSVFLSLATTTFELTVFTTVRGPL